MRIRKFQIQHYKCIANSGWCHVSPDVTVFAGKNESGKTAVLEALRDFGTSVSRIPEGASPLDESGEPSVNVTFELDASEVRSLTKLSGVADRVHFGALLTQSGLSLLKNADGTYELDSELTKILDGDQERQHEALVTEVRDCVVGFEAAGVQGIEKPELDGVWSYEEVEAEVSAVFMTAQQALPGLPGR